MEWDKMLTQAFTNYVAPILSTLILLMVGAAVRKLTQYFGIKLSDAQAAAIDKAAENLVLSAEENVAAQIKHYGRTLVSSDKMAVVVAGLLDQFPALQPDQARVVAQAMVAKIPGIGITQIPCKEEVTCA